MSTGGVVEILLYIALLTALTPVMGGYLARVFRGDLQALAFVERPFYRLLGVDPARGQDWKRYARSVLVVSIAGSVLLYVIVRTQGATWDLTFNTTASFVTNTNWQFYAGETTLSNFAQMAGLAVQNFISAGVGIAVLVAFVRGLASRSGKEIGVFYVDLTRTILYVLLPLSIVVGLVLVSQGVIQSLSAGPVGSQEAIKLLGTNGGGFFNVNSAHPYENPTWLSNFVEMLAILIIPAGLTSMYGRMVDNRRQGWMVFGAMMSLFVVAVAVIYINETGPTAAMQAAGLTGDNLEGKEMRFGIGSTSLFAAITTAASCGAVNGAMESLSGGTAAVPMAQMMTGEVIWGGVGSGLYSMLLFVILGVFISGLMIGRTPEFLGKKIEAREIKLTIIGTIAVPLLVLVTTAMAIGSKWGAPSISSSGPQGFSETLYAYTSQGNNNGSAFAGYTGYVQPNGTNDGAFGISFADVLGGLTMLGGRFIPMLAVLAVAGSLAGKRVAPVGLGTLRTDTPTFGVVLVAVVLIVALLTFVPALLLGPVVQGLSDQLY
jgi:potassium-transporting ATPase potassium-binding subunit